MPTFGSVEPGVYVRTEYEAVAPVIPTIFVTALIGRTSLNKAASATILRNNAEGYNVALSADGLSVVAGVVDADETIRRDYLGEYAAVSKDANSALLVSAIQDALGATRLKGLEYDWVPVANGTAADDNVYIEWTTRYQVAPSGTDPLFCGPAGTGLCVEIARATEETGWTNQTDPITSIDGAQNLVLSYSDPDYTLTWGGGTPSGTFQAEAGYFEATLADAATDEIKVRVDKSKLAGLGITTSATNAVTLSTSGPAAAATTTAGTYSATLYGTKFTVTYETPKTADDIGIVLCDTIADVQTLHGSLTASTPTDSLSLGAVPYFRQGGGPVKTLPLRDVLIDSANGFDLTNDGGYVSAVEDALNTLAASNDGTDVTMIVVLSETETGVYRSGIISAVKAHVLNANAEQTRRPCMAILGARANTITESVFTNNALAIASNAICYVCPATATLTTGGFTYTCGGSTIAAAIAGMHSKPEMDAGAPFEREPFVAFDDIPDRFSRIQKNRMGEINGVLVIEKQSGTPKIRHFVSTDPTNALMSEAKIKRLEIDIRRTVEQMLHGALINTRLVTGTTIQTARSLIGWLFDEKVKAEIINDGRIDSIQVNPTEPRQLDIRLSVFPVWNLNWIHVTATFMAS